MMFEQSDVAVYLVCQQVSHFCEKDLSESTALVVE